VTPSEEGLERLPGAVWPERDAVGGEDVATGAELVQLSRDRDTQKVAEEECPDRAVGHDENVAGVRAPVPEDAGDGRDDPTLRVHRALPASTL